MTIDSGSICRCDALFLVERVPEGSTGLVYLDPPWPRGRERFVDEWNSTTSFEDHMAYLAEVLQHSRRILTDRGNLCFHSDVLLSPDARHLLNEIFGREGFRTEVIIPARVQNDRLLPSHTQVLVYGKGPNSVYNAPHRPLSQEEIAQAYRNDDADPRGSYRLVSLTNRLSRPQMAFSWRGFVPPAGQVWRHTMERLESLDAEGRIVWRGNVPLQKSYLSEKAGVPLGSVWNDAGPESLSIEGKRYPGAQRVKTMERVVKMTTESHDLVVNIFCGTGATGVAAEVTGRRWIVGDKNPVMADNAARRLEELEPARTIPVREDERTLLRFAPYLMPFGRKIRPVPSYVERTVLPYGEPLGLVERMECEFKEVLTEKPVRKIKDEAYKYAIAYLNGEGGDLFWGVRDADRMVMGVHLDPSEQDDLQKDIAHKMNAIQPPVTPGMYSLVLYPVSKRGEILQDVYVVRMAVARPRESPLYFSEGDKCYVKTVGGLVELKGTQIVAEAKRRFMERLDNLS